MKLLRALLLLVGATALMVGLLDGIMPKGTRSPAAAIDPLPRAADNRLDAENRRKLRPENNPSGIDAPEQPSPLVSLIGQAGYSCAQVTGVAPIDVGEGVYEIRCLVSADGSHEAHYRVRTREGRVSLI